MRNTNLGIILCIPGVKCDRLQVEPAVEVDGGYDVLEGRNNALDGSDVLLLESEGGGSGGNSSRRGRTSDGILLSVWLVGGWRM